MLDALAQRYGKMPDEIATRPWSVLNQWMAWSGMTEPVGGDDEPA